MPILKESTLRSFLPVLAAAETDSFWRVLRLLDRIQADNYIAAQPGIQCGVKRMAELVTRIDAPLSGHLTMQGLWSMDSN